MVSAAPRRRAEDGRRRGADARARDVLVDVCAANINGLDKMVRNGEFKQLLEYERAFVLGHEAERTGR